MTRSAVKAAVATGDLRIQQLRHPSEDDADGRAAEAMGGGPRGVDSGTRNRGGGKRGRRGRDGEIRRRNR